MNISSAPITESYVSDSATMAAAAITSQHAELLPVPVPDWSRARPVWRACWPAHVYGFACAFLLAAALSVGSAPYCFRCRRSPRPTVATSTVSVIVGVVCLAQSSVLLVDAYNSTGRLPVAVVQLVHGLVFPGIVSTLTILDRIFSALVKPRQQLGSIKHPRLIATALSVYLLSTSATYLVISVRPQTRLWLLVCHVVSLTWGCAALFLVVCQCFRLARYARLTAKSRHQSAVYIRAKRRVDQCPGDSERRYELLKHLATLRVARTKADEFAQQQTTDERRAFADVDVHAQTSTTDSSDDHQLASDLEVTRTTTLKLSHKHFRYRRRSRRRRHVTGSSLAGSEAVRDFTVTALAAARLLWSPSPESDACCDESPTRTWHVSLHPTGRRRRRHKLNDPLPDDRQRPDGHQTSVTGTDSGDEVDNDVEETDRSSSEDRQQHPQAHNDQSPPVPDHITDGAESDEADASRCRGGRQLELDDNRRRLSSLDASSRTHLLLQDGAADSSSGGPTLTLTRLLRHAVAHWRESRRVTPRSSAVSDAESGQRIACVAQSYVVDASARVTTTRRQAADGGRTKPSSTERRPNDIVLFDNRAYDDVTGCDDVAEPGTSSHNMAAAEAAEVDDCRQVSTGGYVADTEHDDGVDCKHCGSDADVSVTPTSLSLPANSLYLGLNRLRSGRTVRLGYG